MCSTDVSPGGSPRSSESHRSVLGLLRWAATALQVRPKCPADMMLLSDDAEKTAGTESHTIQMCRNQIHLKGLSDANTRQPHQ